MLQSDAPVNLEQPILHMGEVVQMSIRNLAGTVCL